MPINVKTIDLVENHEVSVDFFKRILGNNISWIDQEQFELARGIKGSYFDIITDSIDHIPEGQTYLHFCPVEDGQLYILLTFFPEVSPKEDEDTLRVTRLVFEPLFFQQWDYDILLRKEPFRFDRSSEQKVSLPPCTFEPISHLIPDAGSDLDFSTVLQRKESAIFLLRVSLEAYMNSNEANKMPACSFLSNSQEREKVMEAYQIIIGNLETPKTIRELSRMVGMNECYLKKGFKVTFGKTIHEFQQFQRIEKAKELLKEGKYSINEVAFKMGFGSASHFSSSFKKISGMRPCELLG
jgi:AraC-like DNA-binding protein